MSNRRRHFLQAAEIIRDVASVMGPEDALDKTGVANLARYIIMAGRSAKPLKALAGEEALDVYPPAQRFDAEGRRISQRIIELTAEASGVLVKDMLGPRQFAPLVRARWTAAWLIKKHCAHITDSAIGRILKRDHSTILHALAKVNADPDAYAETIQAVEARL